MAGPYYEVYNPYHAKQARRGRFGTSRTELAHLLVALIVLTSAITLWMYTSAFDQFDTLALAERIILAFGISLTGFALHEIGHKVTAQHFGHWSEFRFNLLGLAITLGFSGLGILFGAPGATWHTATSPHDNGKISAAGPLINLLIAGLAFPFTSYVGIFGPNGFGTIIADGVLIFNAVLAVFNLIPYGQLDGKKILKWNPFAYLLMIGLAIGLLVYANPFGF